MFLEHADRFLLPFRLLFYHQFLRYLCHRLKLTYLYEAQSSAGYCSYFYEWRLWIEKATSNPIRTSSFGYKAGHSKDDLSG
jgi:hypothetical protein